MGVIETKTQFFKLLLFLSTCDIKCINSLSDSWETLSHTADLKVFGLYWSSSHLHVGFYLYCFVIPQHLRGHIILPSSGVFIVSNQFSVVKQTKMTSLTLGKCLLGAKVSFDFLTCQRFSQEHGENGFITDGFGTRHAQDTLAGTRLQGVARRTLGHKRSEGQRAGPQRRSFLRGPLRQPQQAECPDQHRREAEFMCWNSRTMGNRAQPLSPAACPSVHHLSIQSIHAQR